MQEFQYDDDVRIRLTGEVGKIAQINHGRDYPYVVRVVTPKTHVAEAGAFNISEVRCEAFCAAALEPYDPASHRTPPSGGTSGRRPASAILSALDKPAAPPAEDDVSADLATLKADMAEIKAAIERRPTGWQLFWIGTIALFALSAAMEITGGWS